MDGQNLGSKEPLNNSVRVFQNKQINSPSTYEKICVEDMRGAGEPEMDEYALHEDEVLLPFYVWRSLNGPDWLSIIKL